MEMFSCGRIQMRLTEKGCAALYRKALNTPPPAWEGCHACIHCPTGATNAGLAVPARAVAEAARMAMLCPRCLRQSFRMIGSTSPTKAFCVSCYNRDREVQAGKNGKGTPPTLKLRAEVVVVMQDGAARREARQAVLTAAEIMVGMARHARTEMTFSWGRTADAA